MSNQDKVAAFIERVSEQAKGKGTGTVQIDALFMRRLVAEDPETAAMVVSEYCEMGKQNPTFFQFALMVATAYQIESGDDSLVAKVGAESYGLAMPPIGVILAGESGIKADVEQLPGLLHLKVIPADLVKGDVSTFVHRMSVEKKSEQDLVGLQSLWGHCVLTFPVESDPRPVTKIPEVRRFVALLQQAMPYFPCYLSFDPTWSMFFVYFGSLADSEALLEGGVRLNLSHSSVLEKVKESLVAIAGMALRLNHDPDPLWKTILAVYPSNVVIPLVNELRISCGPKP